MEMWCKEKKLGNKIKKSNRDGTRKSLDGVIMAGSEKWREACH